MSKWTYTHSYDEYYDYEKELYALPDEGRTSVDMRLSFNIEDKTCYYTISTHNDSGRIEDWEKAHYIHWSVGIAMLSADGVEIAEALK
jgi:hypothetical protein